MKPLTIFNILIIIMFSIFNTDCLAQALHDRPKLQDFYQRQDYEQALAYLKRAPAPDNKEYQLDLGYVHYMTGEMKEARAIFTTLYQKNSAFTAPALYLAMLFEQQRDYDSALFYYKALIKLLPGSYKYRQFAARQ